MPESTKSIAGLNAGIAEVNKPNGKKALGNPNWFKGMKKPGTNSNNEKKSKTDEKKNKNKKKNKASGTKAVTADLRFSSSLHKVLKSIHPDKTISKEAMKIMNDYSVLAFEQLTENAADIMRYNRGKDATLNQDDIQHATRTVLPYTLASEAVQQARDTVDNFQQSKLSVQGGNKKKGSKNTEAADDASLDVELDLTKEEDFTTCMAEKGYNSIDIAKAWDSIQSKLKSGEADDTEDDASVIANASVVEDDDDE